MLCWSLTPGQGWEQFPATPLLVPTPGCPYTSFSLATSHQLLDPRPLTLDCSASLLALPAALAPCPQQQGGQGSMAGTCCSSSRIKTNSLSVSSEAQPGAQHVVDPGQTSHIMEGPLSLPAQPLLITATCCAHCSAQLPNGCRGSSMFLCSKPFSPHPPHFAWLISSSA